VNSFSFLPRTVRALSPTALRCFYRPASRERQRAAKPYEFSSIPLSLVALLHQVVTIGAQTCCALGFIRETRAQRDCAPTSNCIVTAKPIPRAFSSLALSLALSVGLTGFARAAESPPPLSTLTYSGDQRVLADFDRELFAAGNDAIKLAALEKSLFAVMRRAEATFAARQAAAQRLALVFAAGPAKTSADAFKPLGTMLGEDRDSDLARFALEGTPGEIVDALFVQALAKATGRTRLGLLNSIGRRRTISAVPSLAKLLKDSDEPTAAAAARALGQIADPTAVAALHATPEPSPAPIAAAKLAAATRMPPAAALGLLNELQKSARDPVHRAAAFRQSLDLEVGAAAGRITTVLGGGDWGMKQVALESLLASRAPNLVPTLAAKLDSWDPATQRAVIAAFARRGEASALPAVVRGAGHADADVRLAAIEALGFLPGNRDTTVRLAQFAAGANADEAKVARQSLARLNGPEVSPTIMAGAERDEPNLRAVYLEQLALRNLVDGLPLLLKCRADPDAGVRLAAVAALGDLGSPAEQKALLDWTIEAKDAAEQTRALRSLVNVTLRDPNVEERGRAVYALIEYAQPELALRLLPALGRIGGTASAESAARLAIRNDSTIAEPATRALVRWTDATALTALATVVEKAALPESRTTAIEGVLAYFEKNRDAWQPESTTLIARLLASTKETDPRKKLLRLLHRANDTKALALADTLKSDADLAADVALVADVIRANLAGPAKFRASSTGGLSNLADGKTSTRWTTPAVGEEWVEVDFKLSRPIVRITLDQTGRAAEFPEKYEVLVGDTPDLAGSPVVSGTGQRGNKTVIELPAGTRGRYLRIKNTAERREAPWAICELYVD
jgi:HEAT repeat protein